MRNFLTAISLVILIVSSAPASAQAKNVLFIGDSISEYAWDVQALIDPSATEVVMWRRANSRTSQLFLDRFAKPWLMGTMKYDVIHWNHGLWDVNPDNLPGGAPAYEANLWKIAAMIRLYQPQARVIFATTTPVPDQLGPYQQPRRNDDVILFNEIARRVMAANDIPVNDLYSLVRSRQDGLQIPNDVHYCAKSQRVIAEAVAGMVRAQLAPDGDC